MSVSLGQSSRPISTGTCFPINEKCWCSTVRFDEVKYVWKIPNFSAIDEKGDEIESPKFLAPTNHEVRWHLELLPRGEDGEEDTLCIYLYLSDNSICQRVFARSIFSILDKGHKELFRTTYGYHEFNNALAEHTDSGGDAWGWTNFLKKDEYFKKNIIQNDTLTISFEVTFFKMSDKNFAKIFRRCNTSHLQQLSENFSSALENHDFSDFTLSLRGKDFPVHKVVLASRSNYFDKMFKSGMVENELNRVEITDVTEDVMVEMLKFIYTGKCENVNKLADGLLAAADKYDLDELKMICVESISKSLSVDNAPNILVLSDLYRVSKLKSKVIDFILAKSTEIMNSATWNNIMPMYPQLLNDVCKAFSRKFESKISVALSN
ncbi:speckle-type POZ protein B-like [Planococcus citri]|uniref:speckle-type POZ protein B-like n=1 Tax=Planococcus citri TaxID=170843 RepID=UPI0031FA42C4